MTGLLATVLMAIGLLWCRGAPLVADPSPFPGSCPSPFGDVNDTTIRVETVASTYPTATGSTRTAFATNQDADITLSAYGFNNSGGALAFNHPTGIATDGQRLLVTDRWNNRVLIWTSLPTSSNLPPSLVLGQSDFLSNDSGSSLSSLNWPTSVAVTPDGRVMVADDHNDRVLIWNSFPAANGTPADVSLKNFSRGSPANPDSFQEPWAVWTDGQRLVATSTPNGYVAVWNTIPTSNVPPSYRLRAPGQFTSPRSITSDGQHLIIGDESAHLSDGTTRSASFFWRAFPLTGDQPPDFAMLDPLAPALTWPMGTFTSDGRLLLMGSSLFLWNTFPTSGTQPPDATIYADFFGPYGAAGVGSTIASTGQTVFMTLQAGNKVVGYASVPTTERDPDFVLGAPDLCTNTLVSHYILGNPMPQSNGTNLFVASGIDHSLYVYKHLPDQSGSAPDLIYHLPFSFQPVASALSGNRFALAGPNTAVGDQSASAVYLWTSLPLSGNLPDTKYFNGIGSAQFTNVRGVAMDSQYFYVSDVTAGKVWIWRGSPGLTQNPDIELNVTRPYSLSSDGIHLTVTRTDDNDVFVYRVADLRSGATPYFSLSAVNAPFQAVNRPLSALAISGRLIVADTTNDRVLVWNDIEGAKVGAKPDATLGQAELMGNLVGKSRQGMHFPGNLSWDGNYLWVGEYKFANRLLRFSGPPDPCAAGPGNPTMSIDSPPNGATRGQSFTLSGWAVDRGACVGSGVDAIHVYAYPIVNGALGTGQFVGQATYGSARRDVGAAFGSHFTNSGYSLAATLQLGTYRLVAYARSTVTGTFNNAASVDVTISGPVSDPHMSLDGPANNAIIQQPFNTGGWAVDLGASTGSGIDAIHVWAFPVVNGVVGAGQFVDAALLGGARPDVGAVFGGQFANAGFNFLMTGLSPGQYYVGVYVHSAVTGTFNQQQFALVTIAR